MIKSTQGRFIVWDRGTDPYDYTILADNFSEIDTVLGGDGSPGITVNRKADLTGVASSWLGSGDGTKIGYRTTAVSDNNTPRNLLNVIDGLVQNDVPLGTVVAWFRPTSAIAVPDGWSICDGSSLSSDNHSWGTGTTIQLPDLRNKFVLGADSTKTDGVAGTGDRDNVSYTSENPGNAGDTYAPGIGFDSIRNTDVTSTRTASNLRRDLSHDHAVGTYQMPAHVHSMASHYHLVNGHSHTIQPHNHGMNHHHVLPYHTHLVTGPSAQDRDSNHYRMVADSTSSNHNAMTADHFHNISLVSDPPVGVVGGAPDDLSVFYNAGAVGWQSVNSTRKPFFSSNPISITSISNVGQSPVYAAQSTTDQSATLVTDITGGTSTGPPTAVTNTLASTVVSILGNSGVPTFASTKITSNKVDVRPAHVGLLYIIKVKKVFNLIGKTSADSHNRL
jgi:hypothetical protein